MAAAAGQRELGPGAFFPGSLPQSWPRDHASRRRPDFEAEDRGMSVVRLADIRIGRKLGLAFGASMFLVVCLAGLALWSVRSIHAAMGDSERQSRTDASVADFLQCGR